MEENEVTGMDERTLFMSRAIGVALVIAGIYGMYYAYKIYKSK
jgi:ABC-type antimicrobial peptide transport system permease subunit